MQRNFEPMRRQVESWRAQQLSAEAAKLTIYRAFIEGDLEVPKHLARRAGTVFWSRLTCLRVTYENWPIVLYSPLA